MNFNKKLLTLLAIFCVIVSAGVACAADHGGFAGSNYEDSNGVSGSQYYVNEGNVTLEPGNGLPLENQTNPYANTSNTAVAANNTNTTNATGNATHAVGNETPANSTNATVNHKLLETGNPIIALLAVSSIIGGYAIIRRDN